MLFLEERVDRLDSKVVLVDSDHGIDILTSSCENDSLQLGALLLKLMCRIDSGGEFTEDEFVTALDARVDNFLEHLYNEAVQDIVVAIHTNFLRDCEDLTTDFSVTCDLVVNQFEHAKLIEVLFITELFNN